MAAPAIGVRPGFRPSAQPAVDPSNPLGSGLRLCLVGTRDAVTGARLSASGQGVTAGRFGQAVAFNGTAGSSIPLNLVGAADVSIGVVVSWPTFASDDDLLLEFSPNTNANPEAFFINPNSSTTGSSFEVRWKTGGGNRTYLFTRPTAGPMQTWLFDLPINGAARGWFDGVEANATPQTTTSNSGAYGSNTLYIASRNLASLLAVTNIASLCIWSRLQGSSGAAQFYADPFQMLRG